MRKDQKKLANLVLEVAVRVLHCPNTVGAGCTPPDPPMDVADTD